MYLIRGKENEDYPVFAERIITAAKKGVEIIKPAGLKVTLTKESPPKMTVIPFRKDKIAVISIYKHKDESGYIFKDMKGFTAAFIVEEAIPVAYEKTWPDGQPTPGVCLLTLFHRKPGIDYDLFINRWHNGHTPLSLKIHPLWNYNRNVVLQKLCENEGWYDGIVEEQTRTKKELLNPFRFFGSFPMIIGNMISVYNDVNSFIHYKKIESYLVQEYHILSYEMPSQN